MGLIYKIGLNYFINTNGITFTFLKIQVQNIIKRFEQEEIIYDFSAEFVAPSSTVLLGINGSGKSTLLQIISGFVSPSKGSIIFSQNGKELDAETRFSTVSFCAPYLEVIEEMTLLEFLTYHFSFKKTNHKVQDIIAYIGLEKTTNKFIANFSSGMKQRVKLAQAIFADAPVLLLDEPCTNLDKAGIDLYNKMIQDFCSEKIIIVASNDPNEYSFCAHKINVMDFKRNK